MLKKKCIYCINVNNKYITLASKALFILARRCILDSPLSICPIIRSISWNSLHLSQNTALYSLTSSAVLPKIKIYSYI